MNLLELSAFPFIILSVILLSTRLGLDDYQLVVINLVSEARDRVVWAKRDIAS